MPRAARSLALAAMRVLVTGGAGFIGSHFVKRLAAAGDEVVVLDKLTYAGNPANLEGVEHELPPRRHRRARTTCRSAARGCDAIVNFAAETHVDRSILGATDFVRTEFFGTQVLLEEARESGRALRPGLDRRGVRRPRVGRLGAARPTRCGRRARTAASKAGGDLHIPAYVRTFGVNASITRGSNTYGPNQYPEKLIPLFVTNALEGEPLPLYGDGRQVRDWLYVEDHCAGIELVLREGAPGEVYNVGGGEERENMEVVDAGSSSCIGADPSLIRHVEDRPGHDRRYALDSSKLRGLGWAPRVVRATACRRRSSGTATTATGGSRSSRASSARTTSASTPPASPARIASPELAGLMKVRP